MPVFEVGIFNKEVRELTRIGERHQVLSDDWEDLHYFEFVANDEQEARSKAQSKYPAANGYVIDQVLRIDYE